MEKRSFKKEEIAKLIVFFIFLKIQNIRFNAFKFLLLFEKIRKTEFRIKERI